MSGDVYALVTAPTARPARRRHCPSYQAPDTPHPIAYVSTSRIDSSSQHVCEYEGITTGTSGTFTAYELSRAGPQRDDRRHPEVQLLDVSRHRPGLRPLGPKAHRRP